MKRYLMTGNNFTIIDTDYNTTTYIENETMAYAYSVVSDEGVLLQFGRHENLSDLQTMTGLDDNDIAMIERVYND